LPFDLTIHRSTAGIQPPDLIPSSTPAEKTPSKKADFAITLLLEQGRKVAIAQARIQSLNQTFYDPLRYSPIAISIETKIPGEGWDTGLIQLATWASAQHTQLRGLLLQGGKPTTQCLALPLIIIQGHDCYFLIMEDTQVYSVSRRRRRHIEADTTTESVEQNLIGTTTTLLGTFQIIAALQYLMNWAVEVYRPWFEENVLGPLHL